MRRSNVVVGTSGLRLPSRRALVLLLLGSLAGWALYSLAQESYLSFQLNQQAAQLKRQNDELAAQNDGYRRDTLALQSGSAAEEDARLNGYAKPDEKVYLVGPPPSAAPAAPSGSRSSAGGGSHGGGLWSWLFGWVPHG
jgi:cell division protein FtsB